MISVICFSKSRPLQLHAYIESLITYSGIPQESIAILYKETEEVSYELVMDSFPNVVWAKEYAFNADLLRLVHNANELILWGCDDVVYKSEFDTDACEKAFEDPDMMGFTLRQGRNLSGFDAWLKPVSCEDGVIIWDRRQCVTYAWEVSATIYRKQDILDLLYAGVYIDDWASKEIQRAIGKVYPERSLVPTIELITGPNMLEWVIFYWHGSIDTTFRTRMRMACFEFSKSVSFSVNRVQEVAPNVYDDRGTDIDNLYKAYVAGKRLNWRALDGWANLHTHENSIMFEVM